MNSSIVVQTSGITDSQGNSPALNRPNATDSASKTLTLEGSAGKARKIRVDSAHEFTPTAHLRAEKFRQYTEWLTEISIAPNLPSVQVDQPVNATESVKKKTVASTPVPLTQETAEHRKRLLLANPDILATVDPDVLAQAKSSSQTQPVTSVKQTLQSVAPVDVTKLVSKTELADYSIPVNADSFSVEKLRRIDEAHSVQGIVRPLRGQKRRKALSNRLAKGLKQKKAETNVASPTAKKMQPEITSPAAKPVEAPKTATANLPLSVVAWEVNKFEWPDLINKISSFNTEASHGLVNTATKALDQTNRRLGIVGSGRGPGTTTIALYLARLLAARDKSVLLVDADLSKPDLTQKLSIPANVSWLNAVNGEGKPCDSIVRSVQTGICVMPVHKMANRVDMPNFMYDSLGEIVESVRHHFDFVLMDLGPASQIIRELSQPSLLMDAAMLVHNVRAPDQPTLTRNQEDLKKFGVKRMVIAENFSSK